MKFDNKVYKSHHNENNNEILYFVDEMIIAFFNDNRKLKCYGKYNNSLM